MSEAENVLANDLLIVIQEPTPQLINEPVKRACPNIFDFLFNPWLNISQIFLGEPFFAEKLICLPIRDVTPV